MPYWHHCIHAVGPYDETCVGALEALMMSDVHML